MKIEDISAYLGDGILHDEYVGDGAKHIEVFLEFIGRCLPAKTAEPKFNLIRFYM